MEVASGMAALTCFRTTLPRVNHTEKYRYLRISYTIFLSGLIAAALAFIAGYVWGG
ncbi:hypothetical protein [Flaviaesturariibacter aridisoli]|uniref:hypothetical protein n=1 Tax=Flaviaesturariibacter aridisoli TaxID=2545761 RepID=UPI001404826B|nr:hypothetical protein [Flaviaesturariibacter aridisoli]